MAGGRPVGYLQSVTEDYRETNPASDRVEAMNPLPPDHNSSALNCPATLFPFTWLYFCEKEIYFYLTFTNLMYFRKHRQGANCQTNKRKSGKLTSCFHAARNN